MSHGVRDAMIASAVLFVTAVVAFAQVPYPPVPASTNPTYNSVTATAGFLAGGNPSTSSVIVMVGAGAFSDSNQCNLIYASGSGPSRTSDIMVDGENGSYFCWDGNNTDENCSGSGVEWASDTNGDTFQQGGAAIKGTVDAGAILIPSQKATTGKRYLCIDTNGGLVSSASACSGT
jgi:hypothetical protein